MYICMCVCVYVCMSVCMSVCLYVCMSVCVYVWMGGWMDVWMYVCMPGCWFSRSRLISCSLSLVAVRSSKEVSILTFRKTEVLKTFLPIKKSLFSLFFFDLFRCFSSLTWLFCIAFGTFGHAFFERLKRSKPAHLPWQLGDLLPRGHRTWLQMASGRMVGWTLDGHRCSHWMLSRCFAKARDSNDAAIVGLVLPVTKLLSQDLTTSTPFQSIPVPKRKSKLEWQQSNQDQPRYCHMTICTHMHPSYHALSKAFRSK